jgi:hypothetical protein
MSRKTVLTVSALALGAVLVAVPMVAMAKGEGARMERMMDRAGLQIDFAKADADGDGKVTQDELEALRAGQIAALDADGDGFVTAEELAQRGQQLREERNTARTARMLERFDADGDGRLALEELPSAPVDRIFAALDADGDGALTQPEIDAAAEAFAKLRGGHGEGRGPWMRGQN